MRSSVKFKLSDLPLHLRKQVGRKVAADAKKKPKAVSKKSVPNANEARFNRMMLGGRGLYEPLHVEVTRVKRRVYTPDFILLTNVNGVETWVVCEVKGGYKLQSEDRARLAWEIAAEKKAEHGVVFLWARWKPKGRCYECEAWTDYGTRSVSGVACRDSLDLSFLLKDVMSRA